MKEEFDLKELHGLDYIALEYLKSIKDDLSLDEPNEAQQLLLSSKSILVRLYEEEQKSRKSHHSAFQSTVVPRPRQMQQ